MPGSTAASGESVMCGILFSGKAMKDEWRLGIDPVMVWTSKENNIGQNIGQTKAMSMGLECTFYGDFIPWFAAAQKMEHYGTLDPFSRPPTFLKARSAGSYFYYIIFYT
jgi:hypothetical protein